MPPRYVIEGKKRISLADLGDFQAYLGLSRRTKKKRCDERIRRDIDYSHFRNMPRMGLGAQVTRLPTTKVFSALGQIALLVTSLRDWLLGLADNIRSKERNDLVFVLDWQGNQRLEVEFKRSL